jgi:hypothetical protein
VGDHKWLTFFEWICGDIAGCKSRAGRWGKRIQRLYGTPANYRRARDSVKKRRRPEGGRPTTSLRLYTKGTKKASNSGKSTESYQKFKDLPLIFLRNYDNILSTSVWVPPSPRRSFFNRPSQHLCKLERSIAEIGPGFGFIQTFRGGCDQSLLTVQLQI